MGGCDVCFSLKLDNLIAIIDVNNQQADGHSSEILAFEPIVDRWQSFGWYTQRRWQQHGSFA